MVIGSRITVQDVGSHSGDRVRTGMGVGVMSPSPALTPSLPARLTPVHRGEVMGQGQVQSSDPVLLPLIFLLPKNLEDGSSLSLLPA